MIDYHPSSPHQGDAIFIAAKSTYNFVVYWQAVQESYIISLARVEQNPIRKFHGGGCEGKKSILEAFRCNPSDTTNHKFIARRYQRFMV